MKRKVKLTTRHGLHWTLDKGVRVALQALTHKARATFDGFAAGRKPGLPDTGQMSAEQIIENLRAVESMAGSLASQMETNLRMNRWREHLGDDPLDGFGGRGPAEYHYMATHEPEGPGLTRFGNLQLPDDPPRGEGDDLAARLEEKSNVEEGLRPARPTNLPGPDLYRLGRAEAFAEAAQLARASTHPEQWVSGDDREWLLWITSYVLNRHEFTDSAATDARAALTRIATAIKQPASPTPTEQGEDRTRVEWHDGIEDADELALRQLAADIGCGIPYGCQPSIGKWYAAALDRALDRLLPLDPAPEQGEARFAADPAPPRGEGDDLAARTVQIIRNRAKIAREQGTTEAQIIRARALDEAANEFADILPALRASTHPEQSGRVDPEDVAAISDYFMGDEEFSGPAEKAWSRILAALEPAPPTPTEQGEARVDPEQLRLVRNMAKIEASQSDPEQAPAFTDKRRASHRRRADALNAVLAALEPAPPTPTEQGEARVECPSCGSNHPGRKKAVQHSPGRPFASKWCDDGFHEPAPEGEGEAS